MRPILLSLALIRPGDDGVFLRSHADAPPAAPTAKAWTLDAPAAAPTAATIPVAACTSRSCAAPQTAARSTVHPAEGRPAPAQRRPCGHRTDPSHPGRAADPPGRSRHPERQTASQGSACGRVAVPPVVARRKSLA